jgi:hypothetical protein
LVLIAGFLSTYIYMCQNADVFVTLPVCCVIICSQVPLCKVIRFNIEYTIHYFEEEMIEVIMIEMLLKLCTSIDNFSLTSVSRFTGSFYKHYHVTYWMAVTWIHCILYEIRWSCLRCITALGNYLTNASMWDEL